MSEEDLVHFLWQMPIWKTRVIYATKVNLTLKFGQNAGEEI
jgi:hypothetical protein